MTNLKWLKVFLFMPPYFEAAYQVSSVFGREDTLKRRITNITCPLLLTRKILFRNLEGIHGGHVSVLRKICVFLPQLNPFNNYF